MMRRCRDGAVADRIPEQQAVAGSLRTWRGIVDVPHGGAAA